MADNSSLPVASGNETFANNDIGGVKYPRQKSTWGPAGTANDTDVASGKAMPVQLRSATGLIPIGEPTDAKATQTDTTSVSAISIWKQISASVQALNTAIGSTLWDLGLGTGGSRTQRMSIDTAQLAALLTAQTTMSAGFQQVGFPTDLAWPKGQSNRAFSVAFATLTRPANTTAYTAADSISDNATAGSVTALVSGNISDTNNDHIFISDIHVNSTDTGLAGKKIRAYLYNSDPTASTGVGGGDNAAFANKKAGYLGSFMGWMETGFSDGTVGRLVPCFNETNNTQAGGFIVVPPVSGARTLYIQYQAVEAFTPSANSTTIIGTARGWQGRAA